ncbi:hypothetical protein ACQ859_26960 [Roseateles chitinivorans]|uniref:hypothetical protein n=1 Tax=Roseateles chitinivorans TaxID=2917965 RepID=UPI003D67757E
MPARAALILTTAVLVLMLGAVNAQDVPKPPPPQQQPQQQERTFGFYRCGPEGHDLRDSPCPEGSGRAAELPKDKVDPKETDAARQRTAAETRDLAARERERERQAAKAPSKAIGIDGRLPAQRAAKPAKPADPKKPKPKDPKKPPKKKPKVPKSPDGALQPRPTTGADATTAAPR